MHPRIKNDPGFILEKTTYWLRSDVRYNFFRQAVSFINHEKVEGNILEFGVGVGKSLALLGMAHEEDKHYWRYGDEIYLRRQVIGFDAFEGLPSFSEQHPRWETTSFSTNYELYHPWLTWEEKFSEDDILQLFLLHRLPRPVLVKGWFDDTLKEFLKREGGKAALVHVDCDVYESARTVLFAVEPLLQDGSLLLFDDYYCYKGHPNKGEARALKEFCDHFSYWQVIPYHAYSTFGRSFILHDSRIA